MRAWIETYFVSPSHASQVVARRVRAWIETITSGADGSTGPVARRVRAWIETGNSSDSTISLGSPAVCGRGLKHHQCYSTL